MGYFAQNTCVLASELQFSIVFKKLTKNVHINVHIHFDFLFDTCVFINVQEVNTHAQRAHSLLIF